MPEYRVTCPGCARPLNVPPSAVGGPAHCPHCRANFVLPRAADGSPGDPEPLPPKPPRFGVTRPLVGPGFALLMVGALAVVTNGTLLGWFLLTPGADLAHARMEIERIRNLAQEHAEKPTPKKGEPEPPPAPPPDTSADDEAAAREIAPRMVPLHAVSLALGLLTVAGGAATLAGRFYPVALVGCAAAAVNVNNFCCVPGGAAGLWTFLMLVRDEGRKHFGKA